MSDTAPTGAPRRPRWWFPVVTAFALLATAIGVPPLAAHTPIQDGAPHATPATALYVADPDLSQVAYQEMTGQDRFWVSMDLTAGQGLFLQLGAPDLERLADYHPALAVVGPGLTRDPLPFRVPARLGGVHRVPSNTTPEFFDEIFTGTQSNIWATETFVAPATGRYYVVAFDPPQRDGKLWLAIGRREQFGFRDIWTYHDTLTDVRAFHEVSDQPLPPLPALLDFLSLLVRLFNPTPPA